MMEKKYNDSELQKCYEKGYDSIKSGANANNCNFALFTTETKKDAWEKGRRDALHTSQSK